MLFLLPTLVAVALLAPGSAAAEDQPRPGEVSCLAIDHCPEPPPPDFCDAAGNCEVPPKPGCHEGPNGDCLPPWCDPSAPIENCPAEPPHPEPPLPPFCEDGADFCIPPMPPWCDEAGNCRPPPCQSVEETGSCRPPKCDPIVENPKFCRPHPEDPIFCVMGWPSDEPMPECPPVVDPPICQEDGGDGEVVPLPAPAGTGGHMAPWHPDFCFRPPPFCEPGASDPGEGETTPEEPVEGRATGGSKNESTGDLYPCLDQPFYGCFEDGNGNVLCVDPPLECWVAGKGDDSSDCPAWLGPGDPETISDEVKRSKGKDKAKKAKARAKAKAKRVKAAKAKAKAKSKAKAKARR